MRKATSKFIEAEPSPAVRVVRETRAPPVPADAGRTSLTLSLKLALPGSGVTALADETDMANARRNNPVEVRLKKGEWGCDPGIAAMFRGEALSRNGLLILAEIDECNASGRENNTGWALCPSIHICVWCMNIIGKRVINGSIHSWENGPLISLQ
jgi:hypothetical protein